MDDNTKIDLDFKLISLDEVEKITAKDSLDILIPDFEEKKNTKINQLKGTVERNIATIEGYQDQLKTEAYPSIKEMINESIAFWKESANGTKDFIKLYESDCKGTFLEETYNSIQNYKSDSLKILAVKFKAVYKIKNPMLNNAIQTITRNFYITDNKIIKADEI